MGDFGLLLVQLGVILVLVRLVGAAFRRIGQPQVVGEMAAGFALGMRVDFAELRRQSRIVTATGIGSMALPFVTGLILAQRLYPRYGSGGPGSSASFSPSP
jgi:Kef-type K+ transport system membrane component KefB